jgi:signal transduction histidine kinase/ligand-binding sensor domain-containing protein
MRLLSDPLPACRPSLLWITAALALLAGLLCGAAQSAALPPGHVPARSYGPAQGLPDASIRALLQDRSGFIWVAAEDSLYRYDSHRFQAWTAEGGRNLTATVLHEDAAGTLWAGTRAGLYRWNGDGFRLTPGSAGLDVAGLASAPGLLWIATRQGPFQLAGTALTALPAWPGDAATAILPGRQAGEVWVARWSGRADVLRWNGSGWQPSLLPDEFAQARIDSLAGDGQGRTWARQGSVLLVADAVAPQARFARAALPAEIAGALKSARGILVGGRHGDIWVPVDSGLLRFAAGQWTHLDVADSLPAAWTRTVLEDREGNLWIGSRGLHRLRYDSPFRAYAGREGVDGNSAWALLRDSRQRLWLAGSGLAELSAQGLRPVAATQSHHLRSLAECNNDVLYTAGLPGDAVLAYDTLHGEVTRIALGSLASARILRLLCDRAGNLWAATEDAGLLRAAGPARDAFVRVDLPGGEAGEFIGDIKQDGEGRIWAAGRHGLAVFADGAWQRFTRRDGLREDHVAYLLPSRAGTLLVGYFGPGAVAETRYAAGRLDVLRHLDPPAETAPGSVYLIGEDAQQRIWIGGSRGLDRFGPDGWQHYGSADGLVGEDVNNMAFLADANGDVWVGTSAGLARLDARLAGALPARPLPAPVVVLTAFLLDGKPVADAAQTEPAPAGVSRAEFRYAALSYADEEQREYRSRLLGHDAEFRIGAANEQRYAGLGPGSFRFEVAARGRDGGWGPVRSVEFHIAPAWWQTLWLRLALLLAAGALLALLLRWRVAVLQARNQALEDSVDARTRELRASNSALLREIDVRLAAERALSALNTEERRRKERFHLITRIAALISANLDADTLLQRSADAVHDVLGYPHVDIPLLDPAAPDSLLLRARSGRRRQAPAQEQRLPLATGIMGAAVSERRAQCTYDTAADARQGQTQGLSAPRAALAVPILIGDSVLGVLHVEGDQAFDDLDLAGLGIVADYLAVALENARLFRRAQESAILAERRRVAHDLHDNIIQILASISLQAQSLAHVSAAAGGDLLQRAARVGELAQLAVREMRALLLELRPAEASLPAADAPREAVPPAEAVPLADAVQQLLRLMVPSTITVEFDFSRYTPQQASHEQALLRLIQEAVSNAVRHARATALRVVARVDAGTLNIVIADNGKGMPRRQQRRGLGQESMRARVEALGGVLSAAPGPAGGTVVEAELPRQDR